MDTKINVFESIKARNIENENFQTILENSASKNRSLTPLEDEDMLFMTPTVCNMSFTNNFNDQKLFMPNF